MKWFFARSLLKSVMQQTLGHYHFPETPIGETPRSRKLLISIIETVGYYKAKRDRVSLVKAKNYNTILQAPCGSVVK